MNKTQLEDAKDFLLNLLPRAGQIARSHFHAEELPSRSKGIYDVVTQADIEIDEFLQKKLSQEYPQIPIMTEETVKGDLSRFKNEPLLWVVDPLDGTANFARGDVNYSVSIALVEKGIPILGAIFAPVSSRLFWSSKNDSYAYWNGRRMKVSEIVSLDKAVVCTDWSHIVETRDETTEFLKKIYGKVRQVKILGSAATDLTLLARGGVDIYHHVRLFPWDVAAAGYIAKKAGAKVTDIDGKEWNIFSRGILAGNSSLHSKILAIL